MSNRDLIREQCDKQLPPVEAAVAHAILDEVFSLSDTLKEVAFQLQIIAQNLSNIEMNVRGRQ